MKEGIDIAFMGAKVAASKDQTASIAVHSFSAAYNIAQMAHYRYAYCYGQSLLCNGLQVDLVQMKQYQQEVFKHTFLTALDIASLFLIGLSGLQKSQ